MALELKTGLNAITGCPLPRSCRFFTGDKAIIRHGYTTVNNLRFHYAEAGGRGKPLMLFLHGFPEFWYEWKDFLPAFASQYHCVAPDQRGYNLSDKPAEVDAYRANLLIDDAIQLAARFSPNEKFTLVAHDWGAAIAWGLAIKRPELLEKLIILNGVHPGAMQRELERNPAQVEASLYIHQMQRGGVAEEYAKDNFAGFWRGLAGSYEQGHLSEQDREKYLEAYAQPGAAQAMINWYRAMKIKAPDQNQDNQKKSAKKASPYDPSALKVTVPTIVLWGLQDHALLPGCVENLEDFVPQLTLETREDCGHWIVHDQSEWCIVRIRSWLGLE